MATTGPQPQCSYSQLMADVTSRLVEISPIDLDQDIRQTLGRVRQITQATASYLSLQSQTGSPNADSHLWVNGELETTKALLPHPSRLPWSEGQLQRHRTVCVPNVADLPVDAAADQALWQRYGIGAVLSVPVVYRSRWVGTIGLVANQPVDHWATETLHLLQTLGLMMASTQQRLEDERQFQESEARLRLALSAANQGLYDLDLRTCDLVVSPEYATMLGYDPATFEADTNGGWVELLHPEDREAAITTLQAYLAGEIPEYRLEFRLKTHTGDWKWVLSLGKIVAWGEDGQPLRMLGTHTDIDDLKRAEAALRASDIRFRTFMDNSPMAAWIVDPNTHQLEYASQGWQRNYALPTTATDLQGQTLFDLFPETTATIYATHNRWVANHGDVLEVVEPGIRPDQSPGEFLAFKFPLPQAQGPTLVGGVAVDITERNQTEQRLALQSSLLARIARNDPLTDILTALVLALESNLIDSRCAILFCGPNNQLKPGVAPHLPDPYTAILQGTIVEEVMGACGTGVGRRPVIVEDIATDPLWADLREVALAHGLRSCWSLPVVASDDSVFAILVVYHPTPRRPYPHELDTLQVATNLVKVAIEQDQANRALEQLNRELEDRVAQRTEALQFSEARLKEAQQVARLGRWEMDVRTRQMTWSEEVLGLLGYSPTEAGGDLRAHVSATTWAQFNQLIDRALATGAPATADLPIVRLDGSQGCLFVKATSNRSAPGEITRIFGIAMDVSERQAMQAALHRSEERTRATLLALPDLVFRVNRDGRYVEFMTLPPGNLVDPQQAIGKHLSEVLPTYTSEDHLNRKLAAIRHALETQTVQCYEQIITFNGGQRYEEVRVAPSGLDEVVFFIRDISDRKRTELELIRSRDLREAIFNESTDALFLVDPDTHQTLDCNQRAVDLFGATEKSQLIHLSVHHLQVHPFSSEELRAIDQHLTEHRFWSREIEYRTLTNTTFWGNIAAKPITVAGQRVTLVRVTDISDRKQVEAALQQTNQEMARATRMKDEFLANMSHELRTPLNAILGMTESLQDDVFGPLNPPQQKALSTIEYSGSHLLALINDILDLAKIEAGQMMMDRAPTAVADLCTSSLTLVRPQAEAKSLSLQITLPDALPDVWVDERRLRQVLINLLNNAVKFTPTGGTVTLTAASLPPLTPGGAPWLRLTVSDTGIGITPEDLQKLFQPFVQIDSTLNRQYSGTGLGLALVRRIVDLHGGRVQVTSAVGNGSQFSIDLPTLAPGESSRVYPPSPVVSAPESPATATAAPSPLILVVNDNPADLRTVCSYLGARGYRLAMAQTGRSAVDIAKQLHPDLILMDIPQPDWDGLETIREIRADPDLARTIIVALSTLAQPPDQEDGLAVDIDQYISKPVKLRDLATSVRALLDNLVHTP